MPTKDTFTLAIDGFHGPLELLLNLIEQRKLQVNDIALSAVSEEYISYLQDKERIPLSQTAHFVVIAATLLLIKSHSLIPNRELTTNEEEDIQDLSFRLQQYAHVRSATKIVRSLWHKRSYTPLHTQPREVVFTPAKDISILAFTKIAHTIALSIPTFIKIPTARVANTINLEEIINRISKHIQRNGTDSFTRMVSKTKKIETIVHFLALLELLKNGSILTTQPAHFADIIIEDDTLETPHYD